MPPKTNKFVRSLCVAAAKVKKRDETKSRLVEQMARVREVTTRGFRNKSIDRELHELEAQVRQALEKEVMLSKRQASDEFRVHELKERIDAIEHQLGDFHSRQIQAAHDTNTRLEGLNTSIKKLHSLVQDVVSQREEIQRIADEQRADRLKLEAEDAELREDKRSIRAVRAELMEKEQEIKAEEDQFKKEVREELSAHHEEILLIEMDLKRLKDKYDELSERGVDKGLLREIKERIDAIRDKLDELKNSV